MLARAPHLWRDPDPPAAPGGPRSSRPAPTGAASCSALRRTSLQRCVWPRLRMQRRAGPSGSPSHPIPALRGSYTIHGEACSASHRTGGGRSNPLTGFSAGFAHLPDAESKRPLGRTTPWPLETDMPNHWRWRRPGLPTCRQPRHHQHTNPSPHTCVSWSIHVEQPGCKAG